MRPSAQVFWTISAPWDSSGQKIAKYEETPNLAAIVNEVAGQTGWDTGTKDMVLFLEVFSAMGDDIVRYDDTHGKYWNGGNAGIEPARLVVSETYRDAFWGRELLCRPKPTSMQVNIIPHAATEAYVEWGTDGATFPSATSTASIPAETAHHFTLDGLSSNSQYFYRLKVRPVGGTFETGPVRSFLTLPVAGEQVHLCATSDAHITNQLSLGLDTQMQLLETSLSYMVNYLTPSRYHAWVDVGDLVVIRATRVAMDEEETEQRYRTAREYADAVAHSLPLIFVRGNHEEVNGWDYDGTPDNTAIWSGLNLLKYFPPPLPDAFYDGNDVAYPNLGLPGNYFAFTAGSLRIRALDPYLFSSTRPHNGHGETGGSLNGWDWTLGQQQYDWLHADLTANPSLFSVVFIHHLTSCYDGAGQYYGRGGIEIAKYAVDARPSFEWGGEDTTGAYVFGTERPGFQWGTPHDMLNTNGVQVLIKGHDHFFARQALDDLIYVTLAKPDATEEQTGTLWGWRFSTAYPEPETLFLENSGFYSIVANDSVSTYSYVQTYPYSGLGTVKDMFTVRADSGATDVDVVIGGTGRKTWIETVAPNPGRSPEIRWHLARAGDVKLAVYDTAGRLVSEIETGRRDAGLHESRWDGRDRAGRRVASGVYYARLEADGSLDAVKMVVLR